MSGQEFVIGGGFALLTVMVLVVLVPMLIVLVDRRYVVAMKRCTFLDLEVKLEEATAKANESRIRLLEARAMVAGGTFECPICGNPRDLDDGIYEDSMGHQACDEADWG